MTNLTKWLTASCAILALSACDKKSNTILGQPAGPNPNTAQFGGRDLKAATTDQKKSVFDYSTVICDPPLKSGECEGFFKANVLQLSKAEQDDINNRVVEHIKIVPAGKATALASSDPFLITEIDITWSTAQIKQRLQQAEISPNKGLNLTNALIADDATLANEIKGKFAYNAVVYNDTNSGPLSFVDAHKALTTYAQLESKSGELGAGNLAVVNIQFYYAKNDQNSAKIFNKATGKMITKSVPSNPSDNTLKIPYDLSKEGMEQFVIKYAKIK